MFFFLTIPQRSKPRDRELNTINWEVPEAIDHDRVLQQVQSALRSSARYVVVEGFMVFHDPRLVALMDKKIFITVTEETCFQRR